MTLLEMPFTTKEKIVIQSNTYKMREVVEALIVEVDQQKYEELISLKSISSKPKKQLKLKCPQGGCRCRKKEMKRKEKKKGEIFQLVAARKNSSRGCQSAGALPLVPSAGCSHNFAHSCTLIM